MQVVDDELKPSQQRRTLGLVEPTERVFVHPLRVLRENSSIFPRAVRKHFENETPAGDRLVEELSTQGNHQRPASKTDRTDGPVANGDYDKIVRVCKSDGGNVTVGVGMQVMQLQRFLPR